MKVTSSELRFRLGKYLKEAANGQSIEITRNGIHIANLLPPQVHNLLPLSERCELGAHSFRGDSSNQRFLDFEARVNRKLDIIQWFRNWGSPWLDSTETMTFATQQGYKPLITWLPTNRGLRDIVAGVYNDEIDEWANNIKGINHPVYLRPFPEMNLNNESITWHGEPVWLIAAWRHMVNRFRLLGATNAKWVWSPNVTDIPDTPENQLEDYFPGSNFVDVLAVDGYNFGDTFDEDVQVHVWTSFHDLFSDVYERITGLDETLPFWVTETACAEDPANDKAEWIRKMFDSRAFPNLQAVIWFDENKERDWRVDSSSGAQAAFNDVFRDVLV